MPSADDLFNQLIAANTQLEESQPSWRIAAAWCPARYSLRLSSPAQN